jgi:hypothetical protein
MKKTIASLACVTIIGLFLMACSDWKGKLVAVPVTAPWDKMNLPVKEDAVVWGSTAKEFKAFHKDSGKIVLQKYVEALKSQGWVLSKFDDKVADTFTADMTKGSDKIQIWMFEHDKHTSVVITQQ